MTDNAKSNNAAASCTVVIVFAIMILGILMMTFSTVWPISNDLSYAQNSPSSVSTANSQGQIGHTLGKIGDTLGQLGNTLGQTDNPTGQIGDTLGKIGDTLGQSGNTPGQSGNTPGQTPGTPPPGQSGNTPGQDRDGDKVPNDSDNCPNIANPEQEDTDSDGIGDVCDDTPYPAERSATLIVKKDVINDGLGTATASDFQMQPQTFDTYQGECTQGFNTEFYPSFPGSESGTSVQLLVNSEGSCYRVSEGQGDETSGKYDVSFDNCLAVINPGETKTCTITNNDKGGYATLIVKKDVINDDGGTATASDFQMQPQTFDTYQGECTQGFNTEFYPSFPGSESGTSVQLLVNSEGSCYRVSEGQGDETSGKYDVSFDNCLAVINPGETKTCTITNNDKPVTG